MSKSIIWTIVIIIVIAAGIWFWRSRTVTNAPATSSNGSLVDTATTLNADLNNINMQDPDYQAIDSDANSL